MNRRDFLKIIPPSLLAVWLGLEYGVPMLPSATNRYGDLLREFYNGVKNNNLPPNRLDFIVQTFNELSVREEKYKSWLRPQDNKIDSSVLDLPFEMIYSSVLENNKPSITVDINAGRYNHMMIVGNGRTDGSSGYIEGAMVQFNGDTGSNYMHTGEGRLNNSTTGYQSTGITSAFIGDFNTANAVANSVGGFFAFIQNISSNLWKGYSTIYGASNAGAAASLYTVVNFGVWKSTSPITSLTLLTETGSNILAGSVFSVYGIK